MALLHVEPALFTGLVFLFGLLVGSFLNVAIHRLPRMMEAEWHAQCAELRGEPAPDAPRYNLWLPRSACPQCGHPITARENIPLLSAAVAWKWGASVQTAGALLMMWALITLAFIDLDTALLPDSLTLPLLWLGLLFNLSGHFSSLPDAVVGAMAGYLVLWLVYWLFKLATGKDGMGYGDFKLLAAIGAWLGWQMLPVTLLLSSVVGAVVGIAMIVLVKHDRRVPIPFGPYLAGGGLVALFFGADLTQAYLGQF